MSPYSTQTTTDQKISSRSPLKQPTLLVTSASFSTNISPFLTKYRLCPNAATHEFVRQLRCIRPYLGHKTASTIATSIEHSKLDYCNSLYYNLLNTQLNSLQHIHKSLAARTVIRAENLSMSVLLFTVACA